MNFQTPEKVGRYLITDELGRGSMGVVFLGKDPFIDRAVAIKIARPSEDIFKGDIQDYNRNFFHEARSAGRLNHPNIVAIYDADMYENTCYMAMEYVDGPNLRRFCRKDSLLSVDKVVAIVFDACRALDYAHNMGIVHWDIKPENILLDSRGNVKVTDFGIARLKHESISESRGKNFAGITGTFRFMSPQHIEKPDQIDNRNDIFSLGCVLYELLSGAEAFAGKDQYAIMYQILHKDPRPVLELRPELPRVLDKIIAKALHKDPDKRYQRCMDFSYDLAVAARHLDVKKKEVKILNVIDYIATIPLFDAFDYEQIKQLVAVSSVVKVPAGKTVVSEGQVDDALFIVLSGKVAVLKQDYKIDTIERGECFGEMAYLSGQPRAATIETITDCILMKISATLISKSSEALQLQFLKSFAITLAERTARNDRLILSLVEKKK